MFHRFSRMFSILRTDFCMEGAGRSNRAAFYRSFLLPPDVPLRHSRSGRPAHNLNDSDTMTKSKEWKVLDSEYLFDRPWLTVRRERIGLSNGHVIPEYYVLEYPDWVNTLAVTKDGRFLFVRQYRHGLGETCYELCAGVRDPGDASPLDAARRELWEETGYGNGTWREWMVISANPSTQTNLTYCFLATDVEPVSTQHLEPSEELTVHLLTREQVLGLLLGDRIKQSLHAAPLWKYAAENHWL